MLVVGQSFLAQGDSALVASTIILGPHRPFPHPLLHLQIHPSAVVRRCCRGGRQTVQLHSCAVFRHLLVEPSVTLSIQALASLCSVQATDRHLTGRYNVIAGFFTAECFGHLLESRRNVQLPQSNSLSDAKISRRSVASSHCVSKRQ